MRYSVLGGAFQVSMPDRRGPTQTSPWLLRAPAACATAPSRWLRSGARRPILVIVLGTAALGAGAGARVVQQRFERTHATAAVSTQRVNDLPSVRSGYLDTQPVTAASAAATAASALGALEQPAYTLSASVAQALDSVRLTVADAAVMQQLRTQILAPATPATLSGPVLAQLIALVQQSQVASTGTGQGVAPVDPGQLAQAQTAVRTAQQALAAAVAARDAASAPEQAAAGTAAAAGATAAAAAVPTTTAAAVAPTAAASTTAAATTAPPSPALAAAQVRLLTANQRLSELLNVSSSAAVAAAQQAVQDALNATPQAPTPGQLAAAEAAVTQAEQAYDSAQTAAAAAAAQSRAAAAAPRPSAPDPVAAAAPHPASPAQLSTLQGNINAAKSALVSLRQQAAYAADPEIQPAVITARKALAALTAPPDPVAVAAAQAEVAAAQQAVAALQPAPTVAAASPSTTVAPATAPAPTVVVPAAAPAAATTAVPRTAPAADAVAAAEQRLSDAQKQLAALVSGSSGATTALPAGSTITTLTPEVLAAQGQVSAGTVSQTQLTAIEVELRARYVSDAALTAAHLHPSALTQPALAQLPAATGPVAHPLAWPVVGPITQPFGVPELGVGAPHTGADIGAPVGTPVLAAAPGVVSFAGGDPSTGYGYYAIVDHGGGVSTLYGHLALPPLLHAGQFLPQGGLIGLSGSTGFSTGPHLHFEVRLNGTPVDPLKVLPINPH